MPLDSPLVRRAADFARRAHAGQVRKSADRPPYFVHLESVARLVAAHGYLEDDVLAAAYLHDVLEDQPAHAEELRSTFPIEVVGMVQILTERKLAPDGSKRSKAERFAEYLAALQGSGQAAQHALAVSCADKIDNLESIVGAQARGDNVLARLSTRPGQHAPQLALLRNVYAPHVRASLLEAFDRAAASLAETLARWLPGHAVAIAAEAHRGQFDRAGDPYIYHPLRVMLAASSEDERMVAVLHDVIEDTDWSPEALAAEGFSPTVLAALDGLSRRPNETYEDFVARAGSNELSRRVKLLDIADNVGRLDRLAEPDRSRLAEKYRRAAERLTTGAGATDRSP
ncbi:MAG: HD domain-containing protein [Polyangiaceae bacterium]|nr:HD domain-containing protein [Polyangiaceae bacterium]